MHLQCASSIASIYCVSSGVGEGRKPSRVTYGNLARIRTCCAVIHSVCRNEAFAGYVEYS